MKTHCLPIEEILEARSGDAPSGAELGRSREGRRLAGWTLGRGPRRISLIGGAHADEPVGPDCLRRLVAFLAGLPREHPLLTRWTWCVVPHVNPDGAALNDAWADRTVAVTDSEGAEDRGYLLSAYLDGVVRERPGDDLEFGFPRGTDQDRDDPGARPEARAVTDFLRGAAPLALHGSLHGMAFGAGPWFLLEREWIGRTARLRRRLRSRVHAMGYSLHDVDRGGEKGFTRIAEGFCTRPDSESMRRHFLERDDPETAALFRPSSMETARSFGGDPLTIVSEMPLFVVTDAAERTEAGEAPPAPLDGERRKRFRLWAEEVLQSQGPEALDSQATRLGVRPMPLRDQMRLQLAFVDEALAAVAEHGS